MKSLIVISLMCLAVMPAAAAPVKHTKAVPPSSGKASAHATYKTLVEAVQAQDLSSVRFMLHHGADPNQSDNADKTALMYAAASGNLALAKTLLACGADVDRTDDSGQSTVDWATQPAMINLIRQHMPVPVYLPDPVPVAALSVDGDHLETESVLKTKYVEGYVSNNTAKTFDYVTIDAVFFDDAGIQLDAGTDITQHLAPGGVWKFKISTFRDGVTKYKIVKVKGQ